jgi:membrane peptidoglycan carboxypeptidase
MALRSHFGRHAVGIDQAAVAYFGKRPEALTTGEAALLVGLLASPHRYSPDRSPELAMKRRNDVLDQWAASGLIEAEEFIAESSKPLDVRPVPDSGDRTPAVTP